MRMKIAFAALALLVGSGVAGFAQQPATGSVGQVVPRFAPGAQGSRNIRVMSHVPLGRMFTVGDIEMEQELSRPYVYVSRLSALPHEIGFTVISLKDPQHATVIYDWRIENRELMRAYGIVELQRTGRVALPKLERQAPRLRSVSGKVG